MSVEVDIDCTLSCRHVAHGNALTKCLTKRGIDEEKLISFLILSCGNFAKNLDENGRSALHLACSNSKPAVAEFLLKNLANVHQKDFESNFTPLHRAIHYGCLELLPVLKRFGTSFDNLDLDFYTPLQLIPVPSIHCDQKFEHYVNVWGKNKNYNLGIGNITIRKVPDTVKGLPAVSKASINKFHSLFLTSSGSLWGCGHCKEGRFGIGSEATLTSPQEIPVKFNHKNEKIIKVSAGLFHSLILTNKSIYGAGSNKHLQLGIRNLDQATVFKEIPLDRADIDIKNMLDISACDFHSIFVSKNGVFVSGLNVGQFGGIQESIGIPRRLPCPTQPNPEIIWATSNNACICVYLIDKKSRTFFIFYNRKIKTYKNPLNEKLEACVITGGEMLYNSDEVLKYSSQKPLRITILTEHKNIFIWYEDIMQFVKVHTSTLFSTQISSIAACGDDLLLLANGHLFKATIQHKAPKMYQVESEYQEFTSKREIAEYFCSKFSIKRVQHLANVKDFCCDVDGESYIAILSHVALEVKERQKEVYDFSVLLEDSEREFSTNQTSEHTIVKSRSKINFSDSMFEGSGIMDVTFTVRRQKISANRFVVSSRCKYLREMIKSGKFIIEDERLTPEMFRCIIKWIYKSRLTEEDLLEVFESTKDDLIVKKDFTEVLNDWKLDSLINSLASSKLFEKLVERPEKTFKWFSMDSFPDLCDVTILLDENQQLRAHKVILMMRIEYFKMMFYHSWSENSTIDLRHVSINFMKPIIQFAYDNDTGALKNANFTENYMYNMIAILDQYLIEDIKNIFETMIMRKVNLRNCAENLEFSCAYNCKLLKDFCIEFICLNLSRLLEGNVLDALDIDILKELSAFYRKYFKYETDSNHIITPAFDAPTDEDIEKVIGSFDLSSYSELIQNSLKKTPKTKNRLSKSELLRRNYEKEGLKNLRQDEEPSEPLTPKSPDLDKSSVIVEDKSWQKRERKDSGKRKVLTAIKVNEIMRNETVQHEPMVDLKNLRNSISEEPETSRSIITLADFGIKTKKKINITPVNAVTPIKAEPEETKPAWNMSNVELKPVNQEPGPSDFLKSTRAKKKASSPKPSPVEKNFSTIVRNERKDKSNYEKTKSKSLVLTQIEEKAIMELSEFYNIHNIFDENIKIERKVHKVSQNLSQWQHQSSATSS